MRAELDPEINEVERKLLSVLVAGEDSILDRLRQQLAVARPLKRELSGVGFFLSFAVPRGVQAIDPPNLTVDDVLFDLEGLEHGGGANLFVRDGRVRLLEAYLNGENWPDAPRLKKVYYDTGDSRDLAVMAKVWRERGRKSAH